MITAKRLALHAIEPIVVVSYATNASEGARSLGCVIAILLRLP